jgi:hypothetical protein
MGMGDYSPGSVWFYAPNKVAPIIFIILFLISGALHTYQTMSALPNLPPEHLLNYIPANTNHGAQPPSSPGPLSS